MAFYMNPAKRFSDSITLTAAPVKTPKNTREALFIHKAYPNGIFQIEKGNGRGAVLYDRCYTFTDISYVNKDDEDKANVLLSLMDFLKGMSSSFKITVSNQYQNMTQFVNDIFTDINRSDYPEVSKGISMWIKEKMEDSDLHDLNRVLTLTITVRTRTYDEARSYFLAIDTELERLFGAMRSIIVPMKAEQRLNMIRNFFYQEEKKEYDFSHDALYDVIPVSVDQYRDFLMFNNDTYVSVLFARDYDTALDEGKLIHTISDTAYQSFVTIDYAPVEHAVTRSMLRSAYGNNERAISQEADSKKSNNQSVTGISYNKKKKKAELEGYMDQLDDDSEECIQAGLLVVVTAGSEDELAARIESIQRTGKNAGAYLETYNYVQLKAFNTALPAGVRQVKKMRSFYTSSLVALQPFFAPEVTEPGGIFYGINNTTKNLVFANRKTLTSPHGIIIGPTGSGKSYLIKETEITQTLLSTDDDIQIIDPQNETQNVCAMYGGLFLDFTPKSDIHINPMEVPLSLFKAGTKKDKELFIADVTKWATSFTESVMKKIVYTQEHSNFIEQAVQKVYEKVFAGRTLIQPTIKDVRKELMSLEEANDNKHDKAIIHEMVNCLYSYTEGVYDMFAYPSDVDISSYRLVAFGLKNVDENYWQPVMISIMFFLSIRMNYNQELQKATRLVVDETQVVTKNASSAQILLDAVITYRKFGGIVTLAMQNLTRALENPDLRDMFQNCGYKMFFQQVGEDAERLSKIQDLTTAEYEALKSDRPGRSVMVWGKKIIILDSLMSKDNPLYEVFSTNFHEKAQKARQEKMKEAAMKEAAYGN